MGAQYEWLVDQKSHNDISDLSVFDVKFREDDLFSMNKYTGDYEKVEGRRGIYLDIPEEVLIKRLLMRGRKDDNEDSIRTRINIYKKTTEPLIKYFKDLDLLEYIDADRDLKTISEDIERKMA